MDETTRRRAFLSTTLAAGAATALPARAAAAADPLVDKAKTAMLAMQRRAWEQGTAAQALLELGERELVVLLAKDALVNQTKDGRLGLNGDKSPACDPASNGEPVLFAYAQTKDESFKAAADRMLHYLLHKAQRNPDGVLFHNENEHRVWVDAIYMAPPFLAVAGQPEESVKQVAGMRRILRSAETGLLSHIWDEKLQKFERKAFWGVGNGWAAAGMARVIRALPASMAAQKQELAGWVRELVDACLKHQRPDGLFHDVLDDPNTFVETNAAQMLACAIYRGAAGGWLPRSYVAHADRMRAAARSKVDAFGLVQGVCGAPNFDRPGTATEGQAMFLLMEAARRDLGA
jgi:rhamnogalacturonyl hydrolase YesR